MILVASAFRSMASVISGSGVLFIIAPIVWSSFALSVINPDNTDDDYSRHSVFLLAQVYNQLLKVKCAFNFETLLYVGT